VEPDLSEESKRLRKIASEHLRKAHVAFKSEDKEREVYLARVYKKLAYDEEFLRGEPQKSRELASKK
jgi:hypothetical protein